MKSATRPNLYITFGAALFIIATVLAALPLMNVPLTPGIGIRYILVTVTLCLSAAIALVTYGQFFAMRRWGLLLLSSAFFYVSWMTLAYMVASPSFFAPGGLIGSSGSANWLWIFGRAGFFVLLLAFIATHGVDKPVLKRLNEWQALSTIALLNALAALAVTIGVIRVHEFSVVPAATVFTTSASAIVLLGLLLIAGAVAFPYAIMASRALRITRSQCMLPAMNHWLSLLLLATMADLWLSVASHSAFTVGGCVSKLNWTLCLAIFFAVIVRERSFSEERFAEMANEDALTGLGNRRAFDTRLAQLQAQSRRQNDSFGFLMIDIDQFKLYNDHFGHPAGDVALRHIADCIKRNLFRETDFAGRYGGDEFVVLLPAAKPLAVLAIGKRICAGVERLAIPHAIPGRMLTVSVGSAVVGAGSRLDPAKIVALADGALYQAKCTGRNCVFAAERAEVSSPVKAEPPSLVGTG